MFFQSERVINKKILGEKSIKLIEDPESYYQYVKRLKKKRDEINNKKNLEKQIPGNGFLWNNKPKKYNLNYDYTKHLISNNLIYPTKKNNSDYVKKKSKSICNFDCNSHKIKNLKKQHNNIDKVYNDLYINKSKNNNIELNY